MPAVSGNAVVFGDANLTKTEDITVFQNFGSAARTLTAHTDSKIGIRVNTGCFSGSVAEFLAAVEEKHSESKCGKEYRLIAEIIKVHFSQEQ